jgi:hypothetical protein
MIHLPNTDANNRARRRDDNSLCSINNSKKNACVEQLIQSVTRKGLSRKDHQLIVDKAMFIWL